LRNISRREVSIGVEGRPIRGSKYGTNGAKERWVLQQGVDSRQLIWGPEQLPRQDGLEQRRQIAYGTEHDGLDPF
jgi:hypothetical protein